MPLYDYLCTNCQYKIEDIQQSIKDKPLVRCKKCKRMTLERIIYEGDVFVKSEPTTIGQIADRNTKKMGKYERQSKEKQHNMKQQLSEKQKLNKKINSMTAAQKRKWIQEG